MRNIRMEKDIILYYGNPAGYVNGGKAVVDPIFQSEELNAFLSRQKGIGEVKWTDGVYDRLAKRSEGYLGTHSAEKLPCVAAKANRISGCASSVFRISANYSGTQNVRLPDRL